MVTMERVRHYMTLLLLLAYVGQSLAVVGAPCATMAPASSEISAAMPGMDHSGHVMGSSEQVDASGGNCCDNGLCSMSQCQPLAALPGSLDSANVNPAMFYGAARAISSPCSTTTPLYRPPIFR
jgi:hypothetical protein